VQGGVIPGEGGATRGLRSGSVRAVTLRCKGDKPPPTTQAAVAAQEEQAFPEGGRLEGRTYSLPQKGQEVGAPSMIRTG